MIGGTRVDYWQNTLIKRAFIGGVSSPGAAGSFAICQLWNPAASGKMLICERAFISVGAACSVGIGHHNGALTSAGDQGNKYLNEAAPVGQARFHTAPPGATTIGLMQFVAGNLSGNFPFQNPMLIPEGFGLHFHLDLVNTRLTVTFEWIEA